MSKQKSSERNSKKIREQGTGKVARYFSYMAVNTVPGVGSIVPEQRSL
jgi:hypothetical protein